MWRLGIRNAGTVLLLLLTSTLHAADVVELTAQQRQWLQQRAPLVWAAEADYQPFIFIEQGQPAGLSYDLLTLLQKRLGLPLQRAPEAPLSELLDSTRAGRVDLLTSLRPTPERAEYLAFTHPYIQVPTVLLLRQDQDRQQTLEQLNGRKVAVGKGYAVESFVRQHYPDIDWQALPSDRIGVEALLRRELEAVVLDLGSASYLVEQFPAHQLQIGSRIGFDYPLSLAYRKDLPELGVILEQGLRSITQDEREALSRRWLRPLPTPARNHERLLLAVSVALLLISAALLLSYRRQQSAKQDVLP